MEAVAVSHVALLVMAHVFAAPPALMFTDCEGGVVPGSALKTRLAGVAVKVAWFCTAATRTFS